MSHARESIFERVVHDFEHGIAAHLPHHGYHEPQQPAQATTPEDPMSLASIEADIRNSVENAAEWLKRATDQHLPQLQAAAAAAESDPLVQAIEAVFLPDDVKSMLAALVTKLGTAKPDAPAAEAAGDVPPAPPQQDPQPQTGIAV